MAMTSSAFKRWYGDNMTIGAKNDFKVFLGQQGVGRSSFCAIMHPFLSEDVPVLATLLCTDEQGREVAVKHELKQPPAAEGCCITARGGPRERPSWSCKDPSRIAYQLRIQLCSD